MSPEQLKAVRLSMRLALIEHFMATVLANLCNTPGSSLSERESALATLFESARSRIEREGLPGFDAAHSQMLSDEWLETVSSFEQLSLSLLRSFK